MVETKKSSEDLISQALTLLPYLLSKEKVSLSQAVSDLRLPGHKLKELVRLLQLCGVPPYGGGDTFDCYLQGGNIHLEMARGAPERPPRLTYEEAVALTIGTHVAQQILPSIASVASGLREKLAVAASVPEAPQIPVEADGDTWAATRWVPLLHCAIANRNLVRISYSLVNSARLAQCCAEPWGLDYFKGHWHLLAYCHPWGRSVVLRLDWIREAVVTRDTFTHRPRRSGEATANYQPSLLEADILLPEEEARSLEEREAPFLKSVEYLPEGMARIRVVSDSLPWLVALILRYGGKAVVEAPEQVRRAVVKAVEEILRRYGE